MPAPFTGLITAYRDARPNLTTATNPGSEWLFPGRRAGQPLHPTTFRLRLSRLDIPNLTGRTRALRELLLAAPPAVVVVVERPGYGPDGAHHILFEAGAILEALRRRSHDRITFPTHASLRTDQGRSATHEYLRMSVRSPGVSQEMRNRAGPWRAVFLGVCHEAMA